MKNIQTNNIKRLSYISRIGMELVLQRKKKTIKEKE